MRWRWWRDPSVGTRFRPGHRAIAMPPRWQEPAGATTDDLPVAPAVFFPPDDQAAVMDEMTRLLKADPAMVEPFLALADCHRGAGDPLRALQLRERLFLRPGLDKSRRARIFFEQGRDWLAAGDPARARAAFELAFRLQPRNPAIQMALADCDLRQGRLREAARRHADLGRKDRQSHSLARLAQQLLDAGEHSQARRLASKAAAIARQQPEGWLVLVREALAARHWKRLSRQLRKGFLHVQPRLAFTLLEALLHPQDDWRSPGKGAGPRAVVAAGVSSRVHAVESPERLLAAVVEPFALERDGDPVFCLYAALFWRAGHAHDKAREWLDKALALAPGFLLARLHRAALLLPTCDVEHAAFREQMHELLAGLAQQDRFHCAACGLSSDRLFFHCPRCGLWRGVACRFAAAPNLAPNLAPTLAPNLASTLSR